MNAFARLPLLVLAGALLAIIAPAQVRAAEEAPAAIDAAPERDAQPTARPNIAEIDAERARRARSYPVSKRVSRYLARAAETADEGGAAEARQTLEKLNPTRLNPMERALVYRLMAYIAYAGGDYEATIENFQKVIGEEILGVSDDNGIRFNVAQLHATMQQWQKTIDALDEWFLYTDDPDPLGYYLRGIAYFQLEQMDAAIRNTEIAIEQAPEPPEGWLQLLAALYIQKEDYAKATPVLEELVFRFPKKSYWVQLALVYGARDDFMGSLAVQQVAYMQGFLTEDKEVRRLARAYLYHELPYPAARVMEKGLEDQVIEADTEAYEMLANSWIAARAWEKSLGPLEKAASLSDDGELYVRLGQVHLQREQWAAAATAFEKALAKGDLKNAGNATLLLGIAYYNSNRIADARSTFVDAQRFDKTRPEAERWMTHLANEQAQASES